MGLGTGVRLQTRRRRQQQVMYKMLRLLVDDGARKHCKNDGDHAGMEGSARRRVGLQLSRIHCASGCVACLMSIPSYE